MQAPIESLLKSARSLHQAGDFERAEPFYRQIVARDPRQAEALHLLGVLCHQTHRSQEAVKLISQAIAVDSSKAFWHSNLGNAYRELKQFDAAVGCYLKCISLKPSWGEGYYNLGNVLRDLKRFADAANAYEKALLFMPASADVHNNLSIAYKETKNYPKAIEHALRATQLAPALAVAFSNLSIALKEAGHLEQAVEAGMRAVHLDPKLGEPLLNIGAALKDMREHDDALKCFRRAVELLPDSLECHSSLVFAMHSHPDCTPQELDAEHRRWGRKFADPLKARWSAHSNTPDPSRRLRVGYVSGDFRDHVVSRFFMPILKLHDREQFTLVGYSNVDKPDATTQALRGLMHEWRDIAPLNDDDAAQMIRKDQIDLLIDLSLFTAGNRLLVFAQKPAPVQATYLAYCSTSGMQAMDWRITDVHLDPPGASHEYVERAMRLPDTYWCYEPPLQMEAVTTPPALQSGRITFGCLNAFHKISQPAFDAWIEILRQVPGSRLLLYSPPGTHRDRTTRRLAQAGVDPSRLAYLGPAPLATFFENYRLFDIALDPFPWNGGTTSCDALWMGVPIITLAGQIPIARAGVSVLNNISHGQWIASNISDYIAKAVALATDLPRLSEAHRTLRSTMQNSPLMDQPRFVRNLETAYRAMWQDWCQRQAT